ncbi:hypothetical protein LSTR_LSTR012815 [Laodelphax striatellus]|uniref:Uncharacterized protein n=1 Tax=Laodelphax striatellus TaxID=195883 RepID=A0A482WSP9_LAOST|nr:hypothetical protein LSTR_LSTR012815 [Laodelphax striatellus]
MVYQRVNICNHPSTTTLDSRLSYRRLEVSASDYPRPADSLTPPPYDDNTTVQSSYDSKSPYATAVQSPYNTGVQSPCTTVQTYEKNVQSPYTTGVQSPCTTVQSYEKNVQSPYNTGVQSPCTTVQSYEKNVQSPYTTGVQSPCPTPFDAKTVHSPYNPTVQSPYDAKTVQSSPYEPNYQSSYHDEAVKDDDEVWRSGSGSSLNTQFGRISTTDSGYSCLSSSGMNSPMPFLQSDDGPAYSRTIFSRPTSLDVSTSDYDSNAEIVDSPTMATSHNYRHYDSADSAYCANYVPPPSSNRGGCIS